MEKRDEGLEAIERLLANERITLSGKHGDIRSVGAKGTSAGSRVNNGLPIGGIWGRIANSTPMSPELLKLAQAQFEQHGNAEDNYQRDLIALEQRLCERFGIQVPDVLPNTIANGWVNAETNITAVGQTVNDPRNPKTWGWLQRDRTFHTWALGGTGSGKGGTLSSEILTVDGWKPLGDITEDDVVYTRDGVPAPIAGIFDRGEMPVYEVEFKDGTIVECSGDHKWIVIQDSHGVRKEQALETEVMLKEGVRNHMNSERGHEAGYRYRIPLCSPIQWEERDLPIDPYVLGCLLGDGCTLYSTIEISSADKDIVDRMSERLGDCYEIRKQKGNKYGWSICLTEKGKKLPVEQRLSHLLQDMHLKCHAGQKFIPDAYKYASVEQRVEMVKGLMDTDGSVSRGRFRFSSTSKKLRDDLAEVIRSLGYVVTLGVDDHKQYTMSDDGKAYTMHITTKAVDMMVSLDRKKQDFIDYREGRSKTLIESNARREAIRYNDGPSDNELPVPPYIIGLVLRGRIGSNGVIIAKTTEAIREHALSFYPEGASWTPFGTNYAKSGKNVWKLDVDGGTQKNGKHLNLLLHQLRALGMEGRKDARLIPEMYMHASIQARQDLLQGILDINGHFSYQTMEFYAKNPELAKQVAELAISLGYIADWSETKNSVTTTTTIRISDAEMVTDPEKVSYIDSIIERCLDSGRSEWADSLAIVDIRKTDRCEEIRCITVDDVTQSFLFKNYIVTHNSTLLANLIVDDAWFLRGGLLIDPHGDLAQSCLEAMPPYMMHKVLYLDVLDPDYSPGFNPLEFPPNATDADRQEAVSAVVALMQKHFNVDAGMARLVKNLENALSALSYVPGATILDINDFFEYEEVRATAISFMPDGVNKDALISATENIKQDDIASLKNRLSRFQNNRFLKQLFGQSHTTVDFYKLMNDEAVVLCPIKKGATADDVFVKFYGSYIVSSLYKASLVRERIPEQDRRIFPLIIDEFQNFVTGDIENMLAELRKYGLAMVLAHQYIDQISGGVAAAMDNSCKNKIVYTLNSNDAPRMARNFPGISTQDLLMIPKYHIMVSAFNRGGPMPPFLSKTFGPISGIPILKDTVQEVVRENTHRHYMKSRAAIDKEIEERHERLMSGNKEAIVDFANRMRQSVGQ